MAIRRRPLPTRPRPVLTGRQALIRSAVYDDLTHLLLMYEAKGMPVLGAILRVVRWAYEHEMEGYLESLMDTWYWSADKFQTRVALASPKPDPLPLPQHPNAAVRTPQTEARHAQKYARMEGRVLPVMRIKKKKRSRVS